MCALCVLLVPSDLVERSQFPRPFLTFPALAAHTPKMLSLPRWGGAVWQPVVDTSKAAPFDCLVADKVRVSFQIRPSLILPSLLTIRSPRSHSTCPLPPSSPRSSKGPLRSSPRPTLPRRGLPPRTGPRSTSTLSSPGPAWCLRAYPRRSRTSRGRRQRPPPDDDDGM